MSASPSPEPTPTPETSATPVIDVGEPTAIETLSTFADFSALAIALIALGVSWLALRHDHRRAAKEDADAAAAEAARAAREQAEHDEAARTVRVSFLDQEYEQWLRALREFRTTGVGELYMIAWNRTSDRAARLGVDCLRLAHR